MKAVYIKAAASKKSCLFRAGFLQVDFLNYSNEIIHDFVTLEF